MSYLVQTDEISLSNQERLRQQAVRAGKERGLAMNIATPGSPDRYSTLVDRDADYITDFIPALTAAGLAGWVSQVLGAVGTFSSVFVDNTPVAITPVVPNNQVWVFYKVSVLATPGVVVDPVSMLFFRTGAAANLKAQFDLESLFAKLSADGYFTRPVVYDPQEVVTCQVESRVATGVGCRVKLGALIIEPIQVTLV